MQDAESLARRSSGSVSGESAAPHWPRTSPRTSGTSSCSRVPAAGRTRPGGGRAGARRPGARDAGEDRRACAPRAWPARPAL